MDYKDAILEIHEELLADFEDENGRVATDAESLTLYEKAMEKYQNQMADLGDRLRKEAKGE